VNRGVKHLIECHCILPQYRGRSNVIYHKFTVFSEIDESETVVPKIINCNNCGISHKIIDLCKSIINIGKEDSITMTTIDDIKLSLPEDIISVLISYDCDLATWEQAEFLIRNSQWGNFIVLSKELTENGAEGKVLKLIGHGKYRIEPFSQTNTIG